MKRLFPVLSAVLVLSFFSTASAELFVEPPVYGIGVQKLGTGWGISGTADLNDELAGQLVLGPFGDMHVYAVRGLYSFYRRMDWRVYAFGQGSYLKYRYDPAFARESALSFGAGVGLEYDWRRDLPDMLPFLWNIEVGLLTDRLDNKSVSGLKIGAGVHYRF